MRHLRIVTAAIAAVAALLLALGSGSSATAHTAIRTVLPPHVFTSLSGGKSSAGHFYVKGNVVTAKGKRIYLQKAPRGTTRWSFKASTTTARTSGFFRFNFTSKVGLCYRVKVPATSTRRATYRTVGCIVRT